MATPFQVLLSITKCDKNGMAGPKGNKGKLVTTTVFSKAQFAPLLRALGSAFQCLKTAVLTHDLMCATKGYFRSRLKVRNTCHAPFGCKSFLYKLSIVPFPLFIRLPGVLLVVYLFLFFSCCRILGFFEHKITSQVWSVASKCALLV